MGTLVLELRRATAKTQPRAPLPRSSAWSLPLFLFVLSVALSSYPSREHSLGASLLPSKVAEHGTPRVLCGIDSVGVSCLDWPSLVSKRRSSCFHRASVPQQLLTQTFGHQHSGNTRTPRRERPLAGRIS